MNNRLVVFLLFQVLVLSFSVAWPVYADETPEEMLQSALLLENGKGDLHGAIRLYRAIIKRCPESELAPQAQLRIAHCQYTLGLYTNALKTLNELIKTWPTAFDVIQSAQIEIDRIEQELGPPQKWESTLKKYEEDIKSEDPLVRIGAAKGITRNKLKWGINIIIELLSDTNDDVIIEAIGAASELADRKALDKLKALALHENEKIRKAALETIEKLCRPDPIECFKMLHSIDPRVRHSAEKHLPAMCGTILVDIFIKRLEHANLFVKIQSLIYLAYIGDERAVRPVTNLFKDETPDIRIYSAFCLIKLGKTNYMTVLEKALEDEQNQYARSLSAVCMAYLEKTDGIPVLITDLDHTILITRVRAFESLRYVTKRDYGYDPTAPREKRLKAINEYSNLWKRIQAGQPIDSPDEDQEPTTTGGIGTSGSIPSVPPTGNK